jgi:hypothetical protein
MRLFEPSAYAYAIYNLTAMPPKRLWLIAGNKKAAP